MEEYDPVTDTWSSKTPMSTGRYLHAVDVICDKISVIGGNFPLGGNSHEEYDPATDSWKIRPSLPSKKFRITATSFDGQLFVFGGVIKPIIIPESGLSTVEVYSACRVCIPPLGAFSGKDTICEGR